MTLRDGSYRVGPASGRLLVKTGRTGLGSRAGHDLTLEAAGWNGHVVVNTADPSGSSVRIDVDVATLEVREGIGGVKPLTSSDRADIARNIRDKILHTDRYPTITFRSTQVSGSMESFAVDGQLTIMETARSVTVRGSVDDDGRVRGSATVTQTAWGIKPYTAFFGALKLADDVTVELDAGLTPAE